MQKRTETVIISGEIDITNIWPIVSHWRFQALRRRKQLGALDLLFANAHHTRYEHSLGVYRCTKRRTSRWTKAGAITKDEARSIDLYGLLHDIGHGPYSHVMEALCRKTHHEQGLQVAEELRPLIELCDGDFELITKFFMGEGLAAAVDHHPLGADKLDYLERDAHHTCQQVGVPTDRILNWCDWRDGKIAVDTEAVHEVKRLQRSYIDMYLKVYRSPDSLVLDRFIQKMLAQLMTSPEHGPVLSESALWQMTDSELESLFIGRVWSMYQKVLEGMLPKIVVTLRPQGPKKFKSVCNGDGVVFRIDSEIFEWFDRFRHPIEALDLELELAKLARVPVEAVVVVPNVLDSRFVHRDIWFGKSGKALELLHEEWLDHYSSLRESAQSHLAVRVCVYPEYLERVSARADEIFDYLTSMVDAPIEA